MCSEACPPWLNHSDMFVKSVAERWRICRQVSNISAILEKRARNVDEKVREKNDTYRIMQKSIPYKFRTFDTRFRNAPLALNSRLKASHAEHKLRATCHKRILNRDHLLGRQIVAITSLACFRLALEGPSPIARAIRASSRQMVTRDGRQMLICFPPHHTLFSSRRQGE